MSRDVLEEAPPRVHRAFLAQRKAEPAVPAFDRHAYAPEAILRAARRFEKQLADEYRSAFVFSSVANDVARAGSSLEHAAVLLRMAEEELGHARRCATIVETFRSEAPPRLGVPTLPEVARHDAPRVSDRQRALRNVIFTTCISEMNAVAGLVSSLDVTRDPFVRAHVRAILADEVLHGELGFSYVASEADFLRANDSERRALGSYLRFAFAYAERELTPTYTREPDPDDLALGTPPPDLARERFARTMRDAVVPALEALGVPAADAFERRSLG